MFSRFDEIKRMIENYNLIQGVINNPAVQQFLNESAVQSQYLRESTVSLSNQLRQNLYDSGILSEISRIKRNFQERPEYEEILKNRSLLLAPHLSLMVKNVQLLSDSIAVNQANLSSLMSESRASFTLPVTRISESFASLSALSEHYRTSFAIYQYAFEHILSYQRFVSMQLRKIKNEPKELAIRRAQVIEYSGELFEMSEGVIESGFIFSDEIEEKEEEKETDSQESRPNLYPILNQHVSNLYRKDRDYDLEEVEDTFFNSLPAKISIHGTKLISLILEINESTERDTGKPIFTPSTRAMEACLKIPTLIARSEYDFSKIVNLLYSSLYEGAGCSNNRLKKVLTVSQLNPLWNLKHIRLDVVHDVCHGKEKDVEKKLMKIGDAYKILIGKSKPRSGKDYLIAQLALYINLSTMLEEALEILD